MTVTRYSSGIYAREREPVDAATVVISKREQKIIQMLADGLQIKEIVWIEQSTHRGVRWVIENLYRKLGVVTRVGLVRLAIRKGWVKA